jgi:hypothetical protein
VIAYPQNVDMHTINCFTLIIDAVLNLIASSIPNVAEGDSIGSCCFTLMSDAPTECAIEASLVLDPGMSKITGGQANRDN